MEEEEELDAESRRESIESRRESIESRRENIEEDELIADAKFWMKPTNYNKL
jgi:hypothetical protein